MNIADIITDKLPNTEDVLGDSDYDWTNAKSRAVTLAKFEVYGSDKAESGISDERIKEFIALKACVRLIDMAIDYLMFARNLMETKQEATFTKHNLVEILERKRSRFRLEIAQMEPDIMDLVDSSDTEDEVMDVSTLYPDKIAASRMLTPSPWAIQAK